MEKCSFCENEIDEENDQSYQSFDEKNACGDCFNDGFIEASTVIKFSPDGEITETKFDEDFNYSDYGEDLPEPIKKTYWEKTDSWRGYTEFDILNKFEEVADGWVTGYADETKKEKLELADYFEKLKSGELIPPVTLYWIFGKTSNVFSTASKIVIKKGNRDKLNAWLEEVNGGLDKFAEKFA